MPSLLGWEDSELPLLVLEDLSGERWPPPWTRASIAAVIATLAEVAATPPPAGLRMLASQPPEAWDAVAQDRAPFLRMGLCSQAWLEECLPALLEASRPELLEGDALLHFDVRSDNLCIGGDRAVLVDWNLACIGNPAFDVAFWLPSLTLENGPQPDEARRRSERSEHVRGPRRRLLRRPRRPAVPARRAGGSSLSARAARGRPAVGGPHARAA